VVKSVTVPRRAVARLEPVIGAERLETLLRSSGEVRLRLAGRVLWNVNSTATGGGVAEMLSSLIGYVLDLDIDIRWLVINGDPDFYVTTKRLHHHVHGQPGDGGPLGAAEAEHYRQVLAANAEDLLAEVRPGDLVLLHDPQTAGLAEPLARAGAYVVWRCHIGADRENELSRSAWEFLRPYLGAAHRYVFSRGEYVPAWLDTDTVAVIPPSIDPFSPKNQALDDATVRTILRTMGVLDGGASTGPSGRFVRGNGTTAEVSSAVEVVGDARLARTTRCWYRCRAGTSSRTCPG
jgi:trehalose synthase